MRLLVTGGLGFIGSNFIRYLLNKHSDITIINLDNLSYGSNLLNLKNIGDDKRYEFIKGDICDKHLVEGLVKRIDAVVNVAAETHVDRSIASLWPFFRSNVEGVLVLLESIKSSGKKIRFLQVGTDEVYSDIIKGSYKEEDRVKPSSPYSASKAAADLFIQAFSRTYNLDTVITRCTNNFGPFQFPEKFIPKTIVSASLNTRIPIYGTGKNVRDWIYVIDHCEALDIVLNHGESGEIYNVSSGNELTNIDVVRTILKFMNKSESLIEFVEDRPGHDLRYSLDASKIKKRLGWAPKHDLIEALNETIDWYYSNESWWKPLASEQILHSMPWKLKW